MAKSISEEELQLRKRARRRLIGAIALVTIVAVFLPMVLDHEPKPVNQDINIQIPSPNAGVFTSKIVPVAPGAPEAKSAAKPMAEAPAKSDTPAPSEPPKVAASAPAGKPVAEVPIPPAYDTEAAPPKKTAPEQPKPQAKPAAKPAAKPPAKSAPAPKPAAKPAADAKAGFVVQVAALKDADKAKQMQEQIAAAGIKSYTEVVPTAKGNVTRVRAGPFASRGEAEKMRDKLKDVGLNGNIVPR
jgi:DedD protein